jgi:Phage tail protein.
LLTQIDVDSENAFLVPILGVTPKDSLLVRKITGLNPPDIQLFIGDYARDGGIYQGRRVGNRNVVIIFDLNPNPALGETISGLRELLYKAFVDPQVDADYIKLTLHDDEGRTRYVVGYTEKFETEIFDVETMAQISIICPDPYIRDDVETIKTPIDYLTNPNSGWTTVPFTYTGTAETGFEVEILIAVATDVLTLDNNGKKMVIDKTFSVGDRVLIGTVRGSRYITVTTGLGAGTPLPFDATHNYVLNDLVIYNGGIYQMTADLNDGLSPDENPSEWTYLSTSAIASLLSTSPWLELHSQSNAMKVYGAGPSNIVATIRSLSYVQSYWGA